MKEKIEGIFKKYREYKMFEDTKEASDFIEVIERAVNNLPDVEQELIEKRYMVKNAAYVTDRNIYQFKMTVPIAVPRYMKIRTRAFESIAIMLQLEPGVLHD